jgi:hypothetical protein
MATTEELARNVLASVDSDVGFLNCIKWIDSRYKQLVGRVKFNHLRKVGELVIPASISDGTIAVTSGSTSVTLTSTGDTFTTGNASAYWYIHIGSEWYHVASIDSSTTLTLTNAFTRQTTGTAAATETYHLVQRYHPVAGDARWLGTFMFTRLRTKLDGPITMDKLDRQAPGRSLITGIPAIVAHAGVDSTGDLLVEVYPYCTAKEILHYVYWDMPTTLDTTTTIPTQIDPYVLKEGVLIDLYRYLKGRALNANKIEAAAVYRNDEHAQRTVWERIIQEAVRTDRGVDDTTMILEYFGGVVGAGEIRNAHDEIYSRGVRGEL